MTASAVVDLAAYRRARQHRQAPVAEMSFPLLMVPIVMFVPVWLVRGYF